LRSACRERFRCSSAQRAVMRLPDSVRALRALRAGDACAHADGGVAPGKQRGQKRKQKKNAAVVAAAQPNKEIQANGE
jgi:hypothetical protein